MDITAQHSKLSVSVGLLQALRPRHKSKFTRSEAFVDLMCRILGASGNGISKCTDPTVSAKGNQAIEDTNHDDKTSGNQKAVTGAAFGSHFEKSDQQERQGHGMTSGQELSLFGNGQDGTSGDDTSHKAEGHGMTSSNCQFQTSHGNIGTSQGGHSMLNDDKDQAVSLINTNAPDFSDKSSKSGDTTSSPSLCQYDTNYSQLAAFWKWNRETVHTFLKLLETEGLLLYEQTGKRLSIYMDF